MFMPRHTSYPCALRRLYPPAEGGAGTLADLLVEYVDYHVFRALCTGGRARQALQHPMVQRAIRWFNRAPFLTTFIFALTPLPDWALRLVAPAAGYPVARYLLAMSQHLQTLTQRHELRDPRRATTPGCCCLSLTIGITLVRRKARTT